MVMSLSIFIRQPSFSLKDFYLGDNMVEKLVILGYIELRPANPKYPNFKVTEDDKFEVWGVVIHLIRTFEKI